MITFSSPFATLARTIQMRDPDFGDERETTIHTKVAFMMDGSIRSQLTTPATFKLTMRFSGLTRTKAIELRDFLVATVGQDVLYVDYDRVEWRGHILTSPAKIVTDSRGPGNSSGERKESNNVTIEFEGVQA